jgi:predicted dehydrogenase
MVAAQSRSQATCRASAPSRGPEENNVVAEIKVAFVGAGYMAEEHMRAFAGLPGVVIAGIFSRTRARAERLASAHGSKVFDSVADLYQKTQAHLVIVTVVELSMAEVAAGACFAYPWMVLLEKPAGYDLADATRIRDAARRSARRVFVALNRRAYSSTRQAVDLLAKDSTPRFIQVIDQQDQKAAIEVNKQPELVARNFMFANSIHLIDYFRVLGRGDIAGVEPVVPWNPREPGLVLTRINFTSGDIGLYEGIWNGPGPWIVSVNTAAQRIEMRPLEQVSVQLRGTRAVNQLDIDADDKTFKPGLRHQAMQALAAARGEQARLATIEDSWHSMKLVADIFGLA